MKALSDVEVLSIYKSNHGKVINDRARLNSNLVSLEEQIKKSKPELREDFEEQIKITKQNIAKLNVIYEVGEHKMRKTSPFTPVNKVKKQIEEFEIPVFVDWGLADDPLFQELFDCLSNMPCIDQLPEAYKKEREDLLLYPNEEMIRRCLGRPPNNIEFPRTYIKSIARALDHRRLPIYFRWQSKAWFKKNK